MKPKGETKTNYVHKKRRYRELLYCFYTQKSFPLIKSWNIANLRFFVADCPEKNVSFWWNQRNEGMNESYFFLETEAAVNSFHKFSIKVEFVFDLSHKEKPLLLFHKHLTLNYNMAGQ